MNINVTKKSFKDVRVDEKIYILDYKTQDIKEVTVVKSCIHPNTKTGQVWIIEAMMPFRIQAVSDEALKETEKYGSRVTNTFYLDKDDCMALLQSTIPTMIATEHKMLQEWKTKSNLGLITPRRNR